MNSQSYMPGKDAPLEATIPNSYHIPFNELEDRMDEMGCTRQAKGPWNCTQAAHIANANAVR